MPFPAEWDWPIWIGNTQSARFRLQNGTTPVLLTGSVIVVTMTWSDGSLVLRSDGASPAVVSDDQTVEAIKGYFTVSLTMAQTRQLPVRGAITFEIERRAGGTETTWLTGRVLTDTKGNIDG